jgi:hypothetical protein
MLRFCGFDIELIVDEILRREGDEPAVCSAVDQGGQRWLIVEGARRGSDVSWFCAPASRRVIDLVATGRAAPADAVMHSETGWVEVVRVVEGHSVPDRRMLCAQLAGELVAG